MHIEDEQVVEKTPKSTQEGKWYPIQYSAWEYTFPSEAQIHQIHFDDKYMHVELIDGRTLSIPLWWIPPLRDAEPGELEKFEISLITWNPDRCAINEIVRISDYLGPCPQCLWN